jgi:hypothetical protein
MKKMKNFATSSHFFLPEMIFFSQQMQFSKASFFQRLDRIPMSDQFGCDRKTSEY